MNDGFFSRKIQQTGSRHCGLTTDWNSQYLDTTGQLVSARRLHRQCGLQYTRSRTAVRTSSPAGYRAALERCSYVTWCHHSLRLSDRQSLLIRRNLARSKYTEMTTRERFATGAQKKTAFGDRVKRWIAFITVPLCTLARRVHCFSSC